MSKVFSGIRPSGKLHLGNYLGAIKNWIELQDKAEQSIFSVVDLHGITTPYDPKTYKQQVMDVILDYLAAGIDPKKSLLIRQSRVKEHAELAWIFNTITPVGWLDRLPNYREKIAQVEHSGEENSKSYQNSLALLAYPVLMAADILLYKSDLVPVGEDQLVHLNLANEIGARFNHVFGLTGQGLPAHAGRGQGEVFPNIKAHVVGGARIMSLQDPLKKMSKTGDEGIALSDEPDIIRAKFKKATTDSEKEVKFDEENKPGISNLLTIYSLLSKKETQDIEKEYVGKNYGDFKSDLAEVVVDFLKPFQERRKELESNIEEVEALLELSEEKAIAIAARTMKEVREKMGLI